MSKGIDYRIQRKLLKADKPTAVRPPAHEHQPQEDSAAEIASCLHCRRESCTNCLMRVHKRKTKIKK